MVVPSPSEMDAAASRVHVVADMLFQKAREVQTKGNAPAAQSLADSAADLQRAGALLLELARHVHTSTPGLTRRDSEVSLASLASMNSSVFHSHTHSYPPPPSSVASETHSTVFNGTTTATTATTIASSVGSLSFSPPQASSSIKDLVAKLARVEGMLAKKSDEMKTKGNDGAAHALQQSALAVRLGVQHIGDQQKMTRTLVVAARTLREQLREQYRVVLVDEELPDDAPLDDELRQRAMDRVGELVAWRNAVLSVLPGVGSSAEELREALAQMRGENDVVASDWQVECGLREREMDEAKTKHAHELAAARSHTANMEIQCAALEKALRELEAEYHERRERELAHLEALHARQKETHEELSKLLGAKEAEVEALKMQVESWRNETSRQRDAFAELQAQREDGRKLHDRQMNELRELVEGQDQELHHTRSNVQQLQEEMERVAQASEASSSLGREDSDLAKQVEELQIQLEQSRARETANASQLEKALKEMDAVCGVQVEVNHLQAELEYAAELCREQAERIEELEILLADTQSHATSSASSIDEMQSRIDDLLVQVDEERNQREAVEMELKEAEQKSKELEEVLEKHTSELEGALAEAREAAKRMKDEAAMKDVKLEELTMGAHQYEQKAEAATEAVRLLECEIEEMIRTLEELNGDDRVRVFEAHDATRCLWAKVIERLESTEAQWSQLATTSQCLTTELRSVVELFDVSCAAEAEPVEMARIIKEQVVSLQQASRAVETRAQGQQQEFEAKVQALTASITALEAQLATTTAERVLVEQAATSTQVSDMEQARLRLVEMEAEFKRYRTRSHAALKKMEKRAELLNGMRKENETLSKSVEDMKEQQEALETKAADALAQATEARHLLATKEEELEAKMNEHTAALDAAEQLRVALDGEKQSLVAALHAAQDQVSALQNEKERLVESTNALHEQELAARNDEVEKMKQTLGELEQRDGETQAKLEASLRRECELQSTLEALQTELEKARRDHETVAHIENDLKAKSAQLVSRVQELEASIAEKDRALRSAEDRHRRELEESNQRHALAVREAESDHGSNGHAEHELKIHELEHESAAATREVAVLRARIATLASSEDRSTALDTMTQALRGKDEQIMRLMAQLEEMAKRQEEDPRALETLTRELRVAKSQNTSDDHVEAMQKTIQGLRRHIMELDATEPPAAILDEQQVADEVRTAHAERLKKREQYAQEMEVAKRTERVAVFVARTSTLISELQQRIEDYSSVFRDACALRDSHEGSNNNGETEAAAATTETGEGSTSGSVEYEEYLSLNSGVVIKAGSTFSLPVFCERPGWRVAWKFSIKEEAADVGFALSVISKSSEGDGGSSPRVSIVEPARVNQLSGVYDAPLTGTATLQFEWDNTFSWLNEKTLDYRVSVLEPLSTEKQATRTKQRSLEQRLESINERVALLRLEKEKREQLEHAVNQLSECEKEKELHLLQFTERQQTISVAKAALQIQMEDLQKQLSAFVKELAGLEDDTRSVSNAWEALCGEQDDVDMTMTLSANSRLDALMASLATQQAALQQDLGAATRQLQTGT